MRCRTLKGSAAWVGVISARRLWPYRAEGDFYWKARADERALSHPDPATWMPAGARCCAENLLGGRVRLTNNDRWFFIQMYCWFPSILQVLTIIRPETLLRWHRAGFRHYWRWKSRSLGGRPQIEVELRRLIGSMSVENPLWGAPRIHGELLKLGFEGAQSSVAKYMVKRRGPPSQRWRTFLLVGLHEHSIQRFRRWLTCS
jgi:hypothetical protein